MLQPIAPLCLVTVLEENIFLTLYMMLLLILIENMSKYEGVLYHLKRFQIEYTYRDYFSQVLISLARNCFIFYIFSSEP